ncbi:MAG TPA: hypothetical protein VHW70_06420 [Edaphobacter sp.]|nr:hypothetical protein [Edaphobacter sp.]
MSRRTLCTLPLFLLILITSNLNAQARFAVYGTAGTEKSGLPNQDWRLAGTFGFYYGVYHVGPLDLSVDARGDLSSDIKSGLLGPRLAAKLPVIPLKPYGEFIFGVSSYSRTAAGLKDPNDFAYRYVVGLDTTILPHLDWRVADFSCGVNNSANGSHAKTLTSGLVIRF